MTPTEDSLPQAREAAPETQSDTTTTQVPHHTEF